jgi:hypothetical protein
VPIPPNIFAAQLAILKRVSSLTNSLPPVQSKTEEREDDFGYKDGSHSGME